MKAKTLIFLAIVVTSAVSVGTARASDRDVLTQHNDNQRTGAYLAEKILTPVNVRSHGFRMLYARNVDGFISAQPLYIEGVQAKDDTGSTTRKNLIIVATNSNHIYAFDADSADPDPDRGIVWHTTTPLGNAVLPPEFHGCPTTVWTLGITATPVIDASTSTLYAVVMDGGIRHYLYAIDLTNQKLPTKVEIAWDGGAAQFGPTFKFTPEKHLSRPGLLLLNGIVYIAFGSKCDRGPAEGWIFAYDATTLKQVGRYSTSDASGGLAAVWQSGNGLVGDPNGGSIYFATGNGRSAHRESFVKLYLKSSDRGDSPLVSINHTPEREELFWVGSWADGSSTWRDDGFDQGRWQTQLPFANPGTVRRPDSPLVATHRNSYVDEVFWIGANGDISTTWRDDRFQNGSWQTQRGIALPGSARAGSPLVSINHTPEHEEVFWIGANGYVSSTWRDDHYANGVWQRQFAIAGAGTVRSGSPLVATHRNSYVDEVFWIGANGDISTTWRDDRFRNGSWQTQRGIALPGSARADSPLVSINHTPEHEEVFWIGANGDVSSTWRDDHYATGAWQKQFGIASAGTVRSASPLVATHRNSYVDEVFWIGANGDISTTWRDDRVQNGNWQAQRSIALPGSARADSPLVSINHTPEHEEVFWIGANGDVSSTWRDDNYANGAWQKQFGIAGAGTVRSGSPLVATHRNSYVDEVFWIGANGDISTTLRDDRSDNGRWQAPVAITNAGNIFSAARYFQPKNFTSDVDDADLGSGGPILLPGGRLIGGGKQGRFYVVDSQTMQLSQNGSGNFGDPACLPQSPDAAHQEGFQAFCNTFHNDPTQPHLLTAAVSDDWPPQCMNPNNNDQQCKYPNLPPDPYCMDLAHQYGINFKDWCRAVGTSYYIDPILYDQSQYFGPNIHGGPLYWHADGDAFGRVYGTAEKEGIKAFRYDLAKRYVAERPAPRPPGVPPGVEATKVLVADGMPGGALSLSANKGTQAVIWGVFPKDDALFEVHPARMMAFDATTLATLWEDDTSYPFAKFVPPTIANGRVYRAVFGDNFSKPGQLVVYGLAR